MERKEKEWLWLTEVWLSPRLSPYTPNQWECMRCLMAGIILGTGSANERTCYYIKPSLIGWAHTHNDPNMGYTLVHEMTNHVYIKTTTEKHLRINSIILTVSIWVRMTNYIPCKNMTWIAHPWTMVYSQNHEITYLGFWGPDWGLRKTEFEKKNITVFYGQFRNCIIGTHNCIFSLKL